MREKRREKEKKTDVETKSDVIDEQQTKVVEKERKVHRPEVIIIEPKEIEAVSEDITEEDITEVIDIQESQELLPHWGTILESEWMYSIPTRDEDRKMWAEEWSDFLLEWAQANSIHVFSVSTFLKEPPFNDLTGKVDAFRLIGQALVDKEVADWLDRGRRQLRVYWRPLEDWADILYDWAIKTGTTLIDLKSIIIQESGEDFAQLPERDIAFLLTLIVERGLAVWIDKKKHAIKIEF